MGLQYLGEKFDLHTGGVDHIPVHHENEIAQSEALLGHPAVIVWSHGEFLLVDGGKMSKSLGNVYTMASLAERGYSPMHFRCFCANAHYRSKLNFTWDGLASAKVSYERLLAAVQSHRGGAAHPPSPRGGHWEQRHALREAVLDDLNIPKALGILWGMVKQPEKSQAIYDAAIEIDKVLGLRLDSVPPHDNTEANIPEEIQELIEQRQSAKAEKNWAEADRLRSEIKEAGYEIIDTKDGIQCRKLY
jgi:cysteinyl-tRNA synthetase